MSTYNRAHLIDHALRSIHRSAVPKGWEYEVVICHTPGDPAWDIASQYDNTRRVVTEPPRVGTQNNLAFQFSKGELCLVAGDDDLQSPDRLSEAVRLYESGEDLQGSDMFFMYDRRWRKFARWRGPAHRAGAFMSYARHVLEKAKGWGDVSVFADGSVRDRILAAGIDATKVALMAGKVGLASVATWSAGENLSKGKSRPFPRMDEKPVTVGPFTVRGTTEREFQLLPLEHRKSLEAIYRECVSRRQRIGRGSGL